MRYGSVCSGIEAATMAWHALGWEPAFFSEIEAFPRAVLEHRYPDVPLHGDFTTIEENQYGKIDLLVGGTPCQSFSVAGLRGGLDDERGNLALEFCRLAQRERPRWIVWENVPGVLSSNGGRDFGSILGALAELGYGLAYRVLDAQYFGVAQRRRRVFVVGYLGDWRRAAAVLFERHSMSGHPAPSREKRQVAPTIPSRSTAGGGLGTDFDLDGGLIAGTGGHPRPAVGVDVYNQTITGDVAATLNAASGASNHSGPKVLQQCPAKASCLTAGTGQRFDTDTDTDTFIVHGTQDPCVTKNTAFALARNSGGENVVLLSGDTIARTLTRRYDSSPCHDRGPDVVAFDTTQITSPHNYSNPKSGDPVYPPAIAIQERAICENPDAGPDGVGVRTDDAAYTLEARTVPQAVAFTQNTRDEVRYIGGDGQVAGALAAQPGMKQTNYVAFTAKDYGADAQNEVAPTLRAGGFTGSHQNGGVMPAVAFDLRGREGGSQLEGPHDTANIRAASGGSSRSYVAYDILGVPATQGAKQTDVHVPLRARTPGQSEASTTTTIIHNSAVRRLTPVECERLQGFPDGFTAIPYRKKGAEDCPDGPRYKALGNSMAVPVMRWIGRRIQIVEDLMSVL